MAQQPGPGRPPGHGKTGGRTKGTPNKLTRPIKELAARHGPTAINKLVHLMNKGKEEDIQLAAARELLNRGYGRPPQAIHHADYEGGPLRLADMSLEDLKAFALRLTHTITISDAPGGGNRGD